VNFYTDQTYTVINYQLVHGTLMTVGLVFMIGGGIFIARYLRPLNPKWEYVHIAVQLFSLLTAASGLIVIEVYSPPAVHFGTFHTIFGLLIMTGVVMQGVRGSMVAKKLMQKITSTFSRLFHWWLGRMLWLVACVNVFLGMQLYGFQGATNYIIFSLYGVWLFIIIMLFAVAEKLKQQNIKNKKILIKTRSSNSRAIHRHTVDINNYLYNSADYMAKPTVGGLNRSTTNLLSKSGSNNIYNNNSENSSNNSSNNILDYSENNSNNSKTSSSNNLFDNSKNSDIVSDNNITPAPIGKLFDSSMSITPTNDKKNQKLPYNWTTTLTLIVLLLYIIIGGAFVSAIVVLMFSTKL